MYAHFTLWYSVLQYLMEELKNFYFSILHRKHRDEKIKLRQKSEKQLWKNSSYSTLKIIVLL